MFEIIGFVGKSMILPMRIGRVARRLELLSIWRKDIESSIPEAFRPGLKSGEGDFAVRFRKDDFLAVIDGVEMDARADIRGPTSASLIFIAIE